MPFARAIRLSIRAKVLLLALGLALPPLIVVSLLGLSSLNSVRDTAVQIGSDALRAQAEANLAKRAVDKARLYNATMEDIQRQVQSTSTNVSSLMNTGRLPTSGLGRVWVEDSCGCCCGRFGGWALTTDIIPSEAHVKTSAFIRVSFFIRFRFSAQRSTSNHAKQRTGSSKARWNPA